MEFTRQREQTKQSITDSYDFENEILVKTKHNVIRKIIAIILTAIFWLYTIVIIWFFLSAILNINDRYIAIVKIALNVTDTDIRQLLLLSLFLLVLFILLLFIWRTYNKRKYGPLTRRKMPPHTTLQDWLALDLMEESDIKQLQSNKVTIFYTNPVKDLKKKDEK